MAVIKGQELVKYIAERITTYVETPKDERASKLTGNREPWQARWFGMIPMGLSLWSERRRRHKKTPH